MTSVSGVVERHNIGTVCGCEVRVFGIGTEPPNGNTGNRLARRFGPGIMLQRINGPDWAAIQASWARGTFAPGAAPVKE